MAPALRNTLQDHRRSRGWSQEHLACRAGVSRAEVSGIETGRLVPSAQVALSLAAVFRCRVEDLFHLGAPGNADPVWAWPPPREPCRMWRAAVGDRTLLYPVEATALGVLARDGCYRGRRFEPAGQRDPANTLVIAGCDPAVRLLESELARASPFRLLAFTRSSLAALELLRDRLVHVAGIHLGDATSHGGNESAVRKVLGRGYRLLRVARWQEGVALAPGLGVRTVRGAVRSRLRWIGRQAGSGARRCLDRLLAGSGRASRRDRRLAFDHRGVVEAIRGGWAQAGVCVRFSAEEAGLHFLSVQVEDYDLCYPADLEGDPRLAALIRAVRSPTYRRSLEDLEGYDTTTTGERRTAD